MKRLINNRSDGSGLKINIFVSNFDDKNSSDVPGRTHECVNLCELCTIHYTCTSLQHDIKIVIIHTHRWVFILCFYKNICVCAYREVCIVRSATIYISVVCAIIRHTASSWSCIRSVRMHTQHAVQKQQYPSSWLHCHPRDN